MIDDLARQVLGVISMLALALGPAFGALWFLQRRKRMARTHRRSPLTSDLLRTPGHALREQLEELRIDLGMDTMLLMIVPMFPLAYFQIHTMLLGATCSRPEAPSRWTRTRCSVWCTSSSNAAAM